MQFKPLLVLSGLCAAVSAHFHLQYPPPRGLFVMNNEPTFCDGYPHSVSNRTVFPLNGGFISLTSEHPVWTLGVILSPLSDPPTFQNFTEAVPFFQVNGEGAYCFPVDLAAAGISGVTDGANITIQLEFDGGDGTLFQCADLTLSSSVTIPNNVSCTNATGDSVQTLPASATPTIPSGSGTPVATSNSSSTSSGAPAATSSSAALAQSAVTFSGLLGLAGVVLTII
ncbi:hypothetical protein NM688_g4153 [Phlebia brevispora]|uniref:Uncharacterized protein n=1 Tax=Phlebia brevispora TaxID=194682 RepID=A0ACC1T3F5_9APHY|nr:hypothetical protein NM688_g4153 [Phlebia brevispora]